MRPAARQRAAVQGCKGIADILVDHVTTIRGEEPDLVSDDGAAPAEIYVVVLDNTTDALRARELQAGSAITQHGGF